MLSVQLSRKGLDPFRLASQKLVDDPHGTGLGVSLRRLAGAYLDSTEMPLAVGITI